MIELGWLFGIGILTSCLTYTLFEWMEEGMIFDFIGKGIENKFGKYNHEENYYEPKRKLYTPLFCKVCANFWVSLIAIIVSLKSFGLLWCIGYVFFSQWFISKYG